MKKICVYIGMSLDGYIADANGQVDWMKGDGSDPNHAGTYEVFLSTVDTILMGRKTYEQIQTVLSPDSWPYPKQVTYVVTSQPLPDQDKIVFVSDLSLDFLEKLREGDGGNIWVCGGAQLIQALLEKGQIDRLQVSLLPQILGEGIPLFADQNMQDRLRLVDTISYNGIVDLVYEVRN